MHGNTEFSDVVYIKFSKNLPCVIPYIQFAQNLHSVIRYIKFAQNIYRRTDGRTDRQGETV